MPFVVQAFYFHIHTRRFNPSHQWIRHRIAAGELSIQQMDVQTYFFRRTNMNALGQPRSWTDHLLWHHAAHTIDLFQHQTVAELAKVCWFSTQQLKRGVPCY